MKRTPFYRWYITDRETGARHLTSWRMSPEDAPERYQSRTCPRSSGGFCR